MAAEEGTKIIYYIDGQETPYLVKLSIPPGEVTLNDFKSALSRSNYKFFFKSLDNDFGEVKEEISDDNSKIPCFNGRIISWLVSIEESSTSTGSVKSLQNQKLSPANDAVGEGNSAYGNNLAEKRLPALHDSLDETTETESTISSLVASKRLNKHKPCPNYYNGRYKIKSWSKMTYDSVFSSDVDGTTCLESEDDRYALMQRRRRRKHKTGQQDKVSSVSSYSGSTMSLNIITVTLTLDKVNFLGISIVGQSNKGTDGGIYVGSVMKGGAVALDGRIEPGDMILQVNDVSFENLCNDDAVKVLREAVQKPGYRQLERVLLSPVKLVVAKCWDSSPRGYLALNRREPVQPIDPSAWVAHTAAITHEIPNKHLAFGSVSNISMTNSSMPNSQLEPTNTESITDLNLTVNSDMETIARTLAAADSGLDIRDRLWLKLHIPDAFLGSDLVNWLYTHVDGFADRRDARKYASRMLKAGFIRHTVNKISFSEQCYYVFGNLSEFTLGFSQLALDEDPAEGYDSVESDEKIIEHDDLYYPAANISYVNQSIHSPASSDCFSNINDADRTIRHSTAINSPRLEAFDTSNNKPDLHFSSNSYKIAAQPPIASSLELERDLCFTQAPPDVRESKQSFRMAMGNPCELFIDVM